MARAGMQRIVLDHSLDRGTVTMTIEIATPLRMRLKIGLFLIRVVAVVAGVDYQGFIRDRRD